MNLKNRASLKKQKRDFATSASNWRILTYKGHEPPKLVLDGRQLSKLKNTYSSLPEYVNRNLTKSSYLYFLLAATTTGRLN